MPAKKNLLLICGSASAASANQRLLKHIAVQLAFDFECRFAPDLKSLPHFDPALAGADTPQIIANFRKSISDAHGVIICTPEYVFSVPSGLKNAIEWCVATTVFGEKPVGLITASASGVKGHEELQLLMRTVGAQIIPETTWLISGIQSRVDGEGKLTNPMDAKALQGFLAAFQTLTAWEKKATE